MSDQIGPVADMAEDAVVARFLVLGIPRTKGSARAFVRGKRAIVINDNPKAKGWQKDIATAARARLRRHTEHPVSVDVSFWFPRPAIHFGTGKNAGILKSHAPEWNTSHHLGDLDKLARVVLDALTGVVVRDDSQVVRLWASKCWASAEWEPGCHVTVREVAT